jgi:tetratricopeptide (TPR) repeat protein
MYDEAIKDYTEAIRLDPKLAAAYYNRGKIYDNKGMHDEAQADFEKSNSLGFQ